jgi:hypothetical protein
MALMGVLAALALLLHSGTAVAVAASNGTCSGNFSKGVCLHNAYPILKSFNCLSAAACCSNCTADPKCVSWNINTGMKSCFLRGSYKPNPGPTCISGQVRAGPPAPPPPPPRPPPPPPPPPPPVFSGVTCTNASFAHQPYCNRSLSAEARAAAIIALMTQDEKILMLENGNPGVWRLGIRPMQFGEGLHGVASGCGAAVGPPDQFGPRTGCPTSYPAGIAEGATFNRSLWSAVGAAIGTEARALHNQPNCYGSSNCNNVSGAMSGKGIAALALWAPDINLYRDPRWGRGQEVPGEDPKLTSEYVTHFSNGIQHGNTSSGGTAALQIISTCKHFLGYDIEYHRMRNDVNISARMLVEYYLPAFKACVQEAKVKSIMCSYNAVRRRRKQKDVFFVRLLLMQKWSFYQDGLGTNTGSPQTTGRFLAGEWSAELRQREDAERSAAQAVGMGRLHHLRLRCVRPSVRPSAIYRS